MLRFKVGSENATFGKPQTGNEMDNLLLSQLGIDYVKSLDSLTDNDIYNLISNGIFGYDISSALLIGVEDNKGVLLQSELDDSKF